MEIKKTYLIIVVGLIQGVGFRPFIYRLAIDFGLKGWVNNTNENLQVMVSTDADTLKAFIRQIRDQAPPAAFIESIEFEEVALYDFRDFRIIESQSLSEAITEVSPDIAICDTCLEDMRRQPNRIDYPFLNCTNCGPRFTIVQDLPYDRSKTTMQDFEMCSSCRKEYENVLDRRFHAQPNACRDCGPVYSLLEMDGQSSVSLEGNDTTGNQTQDELISRTAGLIDNGKIVSIKGMGGFFIACDAMNEDTVRRLRDSKHREGKPFAVMFGNLEKAKEFSVISEMGSETLSSWRRPILVVQNRKESEIQLAESVSNGFPTTGIMLPYMPLHYLLFERLKTPAIVLTSGNLSEEPIIIDNKHAESVLGKVSDALLQYNRDIHMRCDDSVGMVVNEIPRLIRRSRGYVPNPIRLELETEGIFAAGAELVNCFAMGKGRQAILSQHIGDLKNFETFEFYKETYDRFKKLFRLKPQLVAHDLHPDYLSTRFAQDLDLTALPVQHHHAHIAAVLAEYKLDEKVIGVSFDGTGLGDDGNIWGSEFMVCDLESYERISHLEYIPMPGGDQSTREPWRMAVSYLQSVYGAEFPKLNLPFMEKVDPASLKLVLQSIDKNINSPLSSGAGRLFDAVAALLDLCTVSEFHAEAPMRLEAAITGLEEGNYPWSDGEVIGVGTVIESIVKDILSGDEVGLISARFHNTIAAIIISKVKGIRNTHGINKVTLSGGTFQNRYLSDKVENRLRENGFEVLVPLKLPANDGGIALGQLAIAAKHRTLGLV